MEANMLKRLGKGKKNIFKKGYCYE